VLRRAGQGQRHREAVLPAAQLREAFLWSEHRTVTKTATVSLHGNAYQVDQALAGRKVELVFDPFDLTAIEVRHRGQSFGAAAPFTIGRHAHPKARPEQPGRAPEPTGISYLNLISAAHDSRLGERINYAALLAGDNRQLPGQMTIDQALDSAAGEEQ